MKHKTEEGHFNCDICGAIIKVDPHHTITISINSMVFPKYDICYVCYFEIKGLDTFLKPIFPHLYNS